MPIDTNVQTFTDAELLALWRACFAAISVGQSYSINGRQMTKADLKQVMAAIDWLEKKIDDANTATAGGIALVQYGERV